MHSSPSEVCHHSLISSRKAYQANGLGYARNARASGPDAPYGAEVVALWLRPTYPMDLASAGVEGSVIERPRAAVYPGSDGGIIATIRAPVTAWSLYGPAALVQGEHGS
jgi:hypothetical protein